MIRSAGLTAVLLTLLTVLTPLGGLAAVEMPVLPESEPYRREFTVTNPYDRAIRVTTVDATCTCSTLELARRFLLPGASTTLTMHADNRNLSGVMKRTVWLYVSDAAYEPIEIRADWTVRPHVFIDSLPPGAGPEATGRRPEQAWRDIYRYLADVRPGEAQNLRKIIRIGSPPEEVPDGGLEITDIAYEGTIWRFEPRQIDQGHWLIVARAADPDATLAEGLHQEQVVVHTNHPDKPRLVLDFLTNISPEAGSGPDPFADFR